MRRPRHGCQLVGKFWGVSDRGLDQQAGHNLRKRNSHILRSLALSRSFFGQKFRTTLALNKTNAVVCFGEPIAKTVGGAQDGIQFEHQVADSIIVSATRPSKSMQLSTS